VIITPFGKKYMYKRFLMGVCQSTAFSQEIMESIFHDMANIECYLDGIGIFSNDYDTHMSIIHEVLQCLQNNGFTVNLLKCEWAVTGTNWLGYWLTPKGLKPGRNKIQAIQWIQCKSSDANYNQTIAQLYWCH
jgi:predicted transcriptional regulator with HTH domain